MLLKSGTETLGYWEVFAFANIDKLIHLGIFALLGFTFMAAFPKTRFLTFIQIMLIYSLLTEILQEEMQLGRSMETLDLLADTIGVLSGYFLHKAALKLKF